MTPTRINSSNSNLLDYNLSRSIAAQHLFNSVHSSTTLVRQCYFQVSVCLNKVSHSFGFVLVYIQHRP